MPDIANLEQDVNQIKVDISAIKTELKHMATKADVSQLEAKMEHAMRTLIMWMVGSIIAVSGIVFTLARYIK
ncbi:MAG: hypothetical protein HZA02_09265 [Nitrospinae bacterium]|nr:hypothetical protein [Nitrospinota bacterium]